MYSCISSILGIAIASFLPLPWLTPDLWWFGAIIFCLVILILFFKNKKIMIMALLGLFLFLGIWRYSFSLPANTPDKIWFYNGQEAVITGVVCNEPDIREKNVKYEINALSAETQDFASLREISGKILVTTNLYPAFSYGDELKIKCELKAPEEFSGFAYDRYLARYNIYSVCYHPKIEKIGGGKGNYFYGKIFKLKGRLRDVINYSLPEPEAGLAGAITLGYKKGIGDYWQEKFSQAGLSHIVAISGLHISILAALVMGFSLGIGLPRRKAFWLAGLFLLVYIFLIGLPASAMRAGLMGFLVLWAMNLGRLNKLTNSLVLAAAILLLINPKLLRDDIGFQLSFLAVLGIAYFFPIFRKLAGEKRGAVKIFLDIAGITLSAQVFTLPVIAFNFGQVSLIAPISNLLVLWVLPFLLSAILTGLALGLIWPSLSWLFFFPAFLALKYIMAVADWLTRLPLSYWEIDYLRWGWAGAYYLFVIYLIIFARRYNQSAKTNFS
ncbi:MAG: ComEC/Rec2 family competence protein [Patescibacteria group bacterium]|nr:ComEC/Rec2 family competence protein [Patescibacteria group bacterium]